MAPKRQRHKKKTGKAVKTIDKNKKSANNDRPRAVDLLTDDDITAVTHNNSPNSAQPSKKSLKKAQHLKDKKNATALRLAQERTDIDSEIREQPHVAFWTHYMKWAAKNEISEDDLKEPWTEDQVVCIQDDGDATDLLAEIKNVVGADYTSKEKTGFPEAPRTKNTKKDKAKNVPAIACLMVTLTTEGVLSFSKRLYDGQAVPKLFSRHTKVHDHAKFLKSQCFRTNKKKNSVSIIPTASGTVSRLDRLFSEGHLTMKHTKNICIDMSRDLRLYNFFQHPYDDDFFKFFHTHYAAPYLNKDENNEYRVILVIPTDRTMRKERAIGQPNQKQNKKGQTSNNARGSEDNMDVNRDDNVDDYDAGNEE